MEMVIESDCEYPNSCAELFSCKRYPMICLLNLFVYWGVKEFISSNNQLDENIVHILSVSNEPSSCITYSLCLIGKPRLSQSSSISSRNQIHILSSRTDQSGTLFWEFLCAYSSDNRHN